MSSEKDRLGLGGPSIKTKEEFGLALDYCDINNSVDLYRLRWIYKVEDQKKFMTAVLKHEIKYKSFNKITI